VTDKLDELFKPPTVENIATATAEEFATGRSRPNRANNPIFVAVTQKVEQLFPPDDNRAVCACNHMKLLHPPEGPCQGLHPDAMCYCDRFRWAPWKGEPDREEFRVHGFPCLLVRHDELGHWCGYVAVPPGHPWHGRNYDHVRPYPEVHGGLTYSSACGGHICHKPAPGESDDVWWLGFDCAHAGDTSPYSDEIIRPLMKSWHDEHPQFDRDAYRAYKGIGYIRAETTRLADQARAAGYNGYMETCHILFNGLPLCRFRADLPGDWPPGHTWVAKDSYFESNCEGCRAALEQESGCSTE
jgi:hypothetical protein